MGVKKSDWIVIGKTIRGAAHVRTGLPNQDAILWEEVSDNPQTYVIAVADGHGSPTSFRSDIGAKLATETAIEITKNMFEKSKSIPNFSFLKDWVEEKAPRDIVHLWRNKVADEIASKPFSLEELRILENKRGIDARRKVILDPLLSYGSTLLISIVSDDFYVLITLGDGDLLLVSETGEVSRPIPTDVRLLGDETFSLCAHDAVRYFAEKFQMVTDNPPILFLISTDGYSKSFQDDKAFLKIGSDFLDIIKSDGINKVEENLASWLIETSGKGSGDDITLGLIYREDILDQHKDNGIDEGSQLSTNFNSDKLREFLKKEMPDVNE